KALEAKRKALQVETENLQSERNSRSKAIGQAKAKGENIDPLLAEVNALGEKLNSKEAEFKDLMVELREVQMAVPNIPHESVPPGQSETDNVEVRQWGEPTQFDFEPKDHEDLGVQRGWLDFEAA